MKTWMYFIAAAGFMAGMFLVQSCSTKAKAGPNGGDLVALDAEKGSAEVVANADTGEVMIHTWTEDLKSPLPIESKPLTLGSEQNSVRLDPHPTPSDPPGFCSRFYGRADWVRGGGVHHGWMSRAGGEAQRQHFDWNRCWKAGVAHGQMWSEMGGHSPGMRQGGHGGMRHE
jgi:hypothetical protein